MGWKIYFWALAILLLLGYGRILWADPTIWWQIVDIPISGLAIAGLYGYAYKKQLIHRSFWKGWFFVIILWDMFYNIMLSRMLGMTYREQTFEESELLYLAMNWSILVPVYAALYLYGYGSDDLWAQDLDFTEMKLSKRLIRIFALYFIAVFLWHGVQNDELLTRAECCGIYGDYGMHYLPFPIVISSELSDWGGGPTRMNLPGVLLNILLPLVIGTIVIMHSRWSVAKNTALKIDIEKTNGGE